MRKVLLLAPLADEKTKVQDDICLPCNTRLSTLEHEFLKAICCLGWSRGVSTYSFPPALPPPEAYAPRQLEDSVLCPEPVLRASLPFAGHGLAQV